MYYISKTFTISAAHRLKLSYESPCAKMHGHNWQIRVCFKSRDLNADGMVCDFAKVKERITKALDHKNLNEVLPMNPTAENMARWIVEQFNACYRAEVEESPGNVAIYEEDER